VPTARTERWAGYASGAVKRFLPRHQSLAICRVLIIQLGDIAICTVSIPKECEDRHRALYVRTMERMQTKKRIHAEIDDTLAIKQTTAAANLLGSVA
jgi:hypothetical protein